MNLICRITGSLLLLCCFNLVHAQDACKKRWDAAASEMDEAKKAFDYKNWQYSSMMYQRAANRWEDAASDCSGKNKENARELVNRARRLSETAQSNLEIDNCKHLTDPASDSFDAAKQASQSQDFARARDLYQRSSEQYQQAVRSCNGPVADTASRNATAAANNASTASRNMEMQENKAKAPACEKDLNDATLARVKGTLAGEDKDYKTAIALLSKAETLYVKLAKNCQPLYEGDFAKRASFMRELRADFAKETRGK